MSDLNGIVLDLPEHEYHGRDELSSTEARLLLRKGGPARYRYAKDNPPLVEPSTKFDIGSAVHSKVLGVGYDIVTVDANDWRTKAAQEAREAARAEGKIALLAKEIREVDAMAEAVLANDTARALFTQPGNREASVFAEVDGVRVRARFDFLPHLDLPRPVAVDLKTTAAEATPDEFGKSVARYGYEVQERWYTDAVEAASGVRPQFAFVVVEKEPPYLTAVLEIPTVMRDRGIERAKRAREIYAECVESGLWPGHPHGVQYINVPNWVHYEEIE